MLRVNRTGLFVLMLCLVGVLHAQEPESVILEGLAKSNPDSVVKLNRENKLQGLAAQQHIYLLAAANENMGHYVKTDSLIKHAFDHFSFRQDSALYLKYLLLLSDQRKITDDFESALKHLYKVLNYHTRHNDTINIVSTHVTMGELFRATENFNLGLEYLEEGEQLADNYSGGFPLQLYGRIYNRRAAILLQERKHLDSVETLSLKVIDIARKTGDRDQEAISSNELGFLYLNQDNPEAERYLENAIAIWDEMEYGIYAANARLNLSRYYYNEQQYNQALEVLDRIFEAVERSDWKWEKGSYFEMMGKIYNKLGDYERAYHYLEKAKDLLMEVNAHQYYEKLALLSTQLEIEKKEQELQRKQREIDLAKLEAKTSREEKQFLFVLLTVAAVAAVLLLALTLFINSQRNRLKQQKGLIANTNRQLEDAIAQKETLLREVNHRVKNNLSVLTGLLYLQQRQMKSQEAIHALRDSQIRINTIALVHESLYQRDDMEQVDFQDYMERLLGYMKGIYSEDGMNIEFEINCRGFTPELSTSIPLGMILNEFISNSFKYAFKEVGKPLIGVEYKPEENMLVYYDNGPGISKKMRKGSLGLKLVKLFSEQINAKINSEKHGDLFVNTIKFK